MPRAPAAAARASLSDEAPKSNTARNAAIAATVLLAPGGFILGSILIARALPDSAYVSQKIGVSHCVLVASPDYLARHAAPETPEDLRDHQCLLLGTVDYVRDEWQLKSKAGDATFVPTGASFSVNDMDAMALAIREGAGIGLLAGFT